MEWLTQGIRDYHNLLKDKTQINKDINTDWIVISTPFIGAFNDTIEIFVRRNQSDHTIQFSDDGNTIRNLELQGVSFSRSEKRKHLFSKVLMTYGLYLNNDEIITNSSLDKFAQKKYDMITAIAELNSFNILSKNNVSSLFKEDVKNYLDEKNIIYTREFISKGKTGLEFTFDFQIAHKNKEIVIKAFNSLNKANVPNFLFTWEDIKENRERISGKPLHAIVIVNDAEKEIGQEYLEALDVKKADCIPWKERNDQKYTKKLRVA